MPLVVIQIVLLFMKRHEKVCVVWIIVICSVLYNQRNACSKQKHDLIPFLIIRLNFNRLLPLAIVCFCSK